MVCINRDHYERKVHTILFNNTIVYNTIVYNTIEYNTTNKTNKLKYKYNINNITFPISFEWNP